MGFKLSDGQSGSQSPRREFVTIAEAADLVRVSQATIRRMLTDHRLTRYKFSARTLIDRGELFRLVLPVGSPPDGHASTEGT